MYNDSNVAPLLHLDAWECYRDVLDSFSIDTSGYGLLGFQNHQRILIPLRSKEMADDIQQHLGAVITILRTEDPDNEWLYYFDNDKKGSKSHKPEQTQPPNLTTPITEAISISESKNLPDKNQETNVRHLKVWDEVEGRVKRITVENGVAKVTFYDGIIVPIINPDDVLQQKLQKVTGEIVSILQTDLPAKTYLIKIKRNKKPTAPFTCFYSDGKERLDGYLSINKNADKTKIVNLPTKDNAPTPFAHRQDQSNPN